MTCSPPALLFQHNFTPAPSSTNNGHPRLQLLRICTHILWRYGILLRHRLSAFDFSVVIVSAWNRLRQFRFVDIRRQS